MDFIIDIISKLSISISYYNVIPRGAERAWRNFIQYFPFIIDMRESGS